MFRTGANAAQVQALCLAQGIPAAIYPTYTYGVTSVSGSDGSNPGLKPEKADTYSIGAVLTPKFDSPWFNHVQLSVDYYSIKIADAIGSLLLTDILPRCYNSDGASNPTYSVTNAYCKRITRDPLTGAIILGQQGLFNFATYTVRGIDTQINWRTDLDGLFGCQRRPPRFRIGDFVHQRLYGCRAARLADAELCGQRRLRRRRWGHFTPALQGEYRRDLSKRSVPDDAPLALHRQDEACRPRRQSGVDDPGVPAYSYFDIDAHYVINNQFTIGGGLTNLTDRGPPFVSGAPLTTDGATYDVVGRTFFVSARAKF